MASSALSKALHGSVSRPSQDISSNIFRSTLSILLICIFILLTAANFMFTLRSHQHSGSNSSSSSSGQDDFLNRLGTSKNSSPRVSSYYWPSPERDGGLLGKIALLQNPKDCSSPDTKFFVWQSLSQNEKDTRGLTAWAHSGAQHLLHAMTDGDQIEKYGSRVLITDEKLWPMAKGCVNGPNTRECYFRPLTKCKLSDVDPLPGAASSSENDKKAHLLENPNDEYDRSVRTLYSTAKNHWFRNVKDKYSFTGLPGRVGDHSDISLTAASLAYYFQPKPWLQKEIDKRLRRSIPSDLNPARTIGVPIRRSDKCHGHSLAGSAKGELDCPPLEKYLEGVQQFLNFDPLIENVILTSEDKSACVEFKEMLQKELPRLRVVQNVGDVQQGTGSGSMLEAYEEGASNADVVASALTSMHLHLRARYFVVTSKSTWTSTMPVMARVYGFATDVFVIDIGPNTNKYSSLARNGCPP